MVSPSHSIGIIEIDFSQSSYPECVPTINKNLDTNALCRLRVNITKGTDNVALKTENFLLELNPNNSQYTLWSNQYSIKSTFNPKLTPLFLNAVFYENVLYQAFEENMLNDNPKLIAGIIANYVMFRETTQESEYEKSLNLKSYEEIAKLAFTENSDYNIKIIIRYLTWMKNPLEADPTLIAEMSHLTPILNQMYLTDTEVYYLKHLLAACVFLKSLTNKLPPISKLDSELRVQLSQDFALIFYHIIDPDFQLNDTSIFGEVYLKQILAYADSNTESEYYRFWQNVLSDIKLDPSYFNSNASKKINILKNHEETLTQTFWNLSDDRSNEKTDESIHLPVEPNLTSWGMLTGLGITSLSLSQLWLINHDTNDWRYLTSEVGGFGLLGASLAQGICILTKFEADWDSDHWFCPTLGGFSAALLSSVILFGLNGIHWTPSSSTQTTEHPAETVDPTKQNFVTEYGPLMISLPF